MSVKDRDLPQHESANYILNGFICCKPGHIFMKQAIKLILKNVKDGYYTYNAVAVTGPGILGKAINLGINQDKNKPLVAGTHHISGFKFTLWKPPPFYNKAERVIKINTIKTDQNIPFMHMEYPNYKKELNLNINQNIKRNYSMCWIMNNVYKHGKVKRPHTKYFDGYRFKFKQFKFRFYYYMRGLEIKQFLRNYVNAVYKQMKIVCFSTKKK